MQPTEFLIQPAEILMQPTEFLMQQSEILSGKWSTRKGQAGRFPQRKLRPLRSVVSGKFVFNITIYITEGAEFYPLAHL